MDHNVAISSILIPSLLFRIELEAVEQAVGGCFDVVVRGLERHQRAFSIESQRHELLDGVFRRRRRRGSRHLWRKHAAPSTRQKLVTEALAVGHACGSTAIWTQTKTALGFQHPALTLLSRDTGRNDLKERVQELDKST